MPTPTKGPRLGGSPSHQKAILSNLATSLFEHGAITTTEAKARRLRPFAERLITKAKRGDLHNRRQVLAVVRDKGIVHLLFTDIGPRYADRPGGYTRITKLGPRHGDNAPMAVIELVQEGYAATARSTKRTRPARTLGESQQGEPPAGGAPTNQSVEDQLGEQSSDADQDAATPQDTEAPAESDAAEMTLEEPSADEQGESDAEGAVPAPEASPDQPDAEEGPAAESTDR